MTNARRRIAFGSKVSQEILCKKAYSHGNIEELNVNELNEILAKIGPVYFKDVESGKYYKIAQFRTNDLGQIERALIEVTSNGTELNRKIVPMVTSNTL
jgi:hypothetical protein